ncbi:MAG: DNA cytosine methyltransferase, partial [Candidatus Thorarchaeota archaeon]
MVIGIVDLFCGAGGFSFGFNNISNGKHLAIDSDSIPLSTYSLNYPKALT